MLLKVECYICKENSLSFEMSKSPLDTIKKNKWEVIGDDLPVCAECYDKYRIIAKVVADKPADKPVDKPVKRKYTKKKKVEEDRLLESQLANAEKAREANAVEVACPECGQICRSHAGRGIHRLWKHGIQGKTRLKGGSMYEVAKDRDNGDEKRLVHWPVYQCRWFGESTEDLTEDKCTCVKSNTSKGHTELLAHEKTSHSKVFHPISEEFRKTTYRSKKMGN